MRLKLLTAPTSFDPLITLAEAKQQCRVTSAADDTLIASYIQAAAFYIQNITGRSLVAQTWQVFMDAFQDTMLLPRGPVRSVSSVKYYDDAGNQQTLLSANYALDNADDEGPAWLVRAFSAVWPTTAFGINNVIIEYIAGYVAMPEPIRQAAKLLVEHFYDNRAPVLTSRSANASVQLDFTIDALLANHTAYW